MCCITFPVQAQFTYRHKNGGRYMRVITKKLAVSTNRRAMEEVRDGERPTRPCSHEIHDSTANTCMLSTHL